MKKYKMRINGQNYEAKIVEFNSSRAKLNVNGVDFDVEFDNDIPGNKIQYVQQEKAVPVVPQIKTTDIQSVNEVKAPIPGVVISVLKNDGDYVKTGDLLLTLEAMKMESEILSPVDGIIEKVFIKEKSPVQEGDTLVKITSTQATPTQAMPKQASPAQVQTQAKQVVSQSSTPQTVKAPLPGTILDIKVSVGDNVNADQAVIVLEAMKMESEIFANSNGTVKNILVTKGQSVQEGQDLIELS
ncbi:MAG: biotin/lipoyl-binding protein [Candidatus Cloacimonetes bacterium]|jgi:pyruvate dehydrogenase E2 component (dihydrolipoamide acetyltransferase)|nr:biotin/lipoyl-binding protein [Candidatus Cloacimonadota bacterium]MDD4156472.1 biotin/lipoyl-binding protein [Candidatus Cloacimonadota bacterium]